MIIQIRKWKWELFILRFWNTRENKPGSVMFKGCSECLIEGTDYSWFIAIFRVIRFLYWNASAKHWYMKCQKNGWASGRDIENIKGKGRFLSRNRVETEESEREYVPVVLNGNERQDWLNGDSLDYFPSCVPPVLDATRVWREAVGRGSSAWKKETARGISQGQRRSHLPSQFYSLIYWVRIR